MNSQNVFFSLNMCSFCLCVVGFWKVVDALVAHVCNEVLYFCVLFFSCNVFISDVKNRKPVLKLVGNIFMCFILCDICWV